jgi:hypothetical protein
LLGEIRRERDGDLALVDRSDEAKLALVENLAGAPHKAAIQAMRPLRRYRRAL